MDILSSTAFKQNLFQVIDEVLRTGIPVEVEHNTRKVMITAVTSPQSVTDRLKARPLFTDKIDFDTLTEWEWNETKNL